jgi:hypothetical protein
MAVEAVHKTRERERVVETELLQEEERGLLQELPCLRLERNNIKVSGSGDSGEDIFGT